MLKDGEHDVITNQALSGAEEAKVSHDNTALIVAEAI
jgi:hypothetical protein